MCSVFSRCPSYIRNIFFFILFCGAGRLSAVDSFSEVLYENREESVEELSDKLKKFFVRNKKKLSRKKKKVNKLIKELMDTLSYLNELNNPRLSLSLISRFSKILRELQKKGYIVDGEIGYSQEEEVVMLLNFYAMKAYRSLGNTTKVEKKYRILSQYIDGKFVDTNELLESSKVTLFTYASILLEIIIFLQGIGDLTEAQKKLEMLDTISNYKDVLLNTEEGEEKSGGDSIFFEDMDYFRSYLFFVVMSVTYFNYKAYQEKIEEYRAIGKGKKTARRLQSCLKKRKELESQIESCFLEVYSYFLRASSKQQIEIMEWMFELLKKGFFLPCFFSFLSDMVKVMLSKQDFIRMIFKKEDSDFLIKNIRQAYVYLSTFCLQDKTVDKNFVEEQLLRGYNDEDRIVLFGIVYFQSFSEILQKKRMEGELLFKKLKKLLYEKSISSEDCPYWVKPDGRYGAVLLLERLLKTLPGGDGGKKLELTSCSPEILKRGDRGENLNDDEEILYSVHCALEKVKLGEALTQEQMIMLSIYVVLVYEDSEAYRKIFDKVVTGISSFSSMCLLIELLDTYVGFSKLKSTTFSNLYTKLGEIKLRTNAFYNANNFDLEGEDEDEDGDGDGGEDLMRYTFKSFLDNKLASIEFVLLNLKKLSGSATSDDRAELDRLFPMAQVTLKDSRPLLWKILS